MPDIAQENAFVEAFIVPERRERYKQLLANRKRRSDFLDRLNHKLDFLSHLARQIPGNQHTPEGVMLLLTKHGMKEHDLVYIISDVREIDGLQLTLHQALEEVCSAGSGSVVCCITGYLAYYRPEEPANGYILEKAKNSGEI